jgi:hypothetical protein
MTMPSSETAGIVRFRGTRQLVLDVVVLAAGIGLLMAILIGMLSTNGQHPVGVIVVLGLTSLVMLVGLVRTHWAATLDIEQDRIVYRTLVRTRHFSRAAISSCGVEKKLRGAVRLWQPYLELGGGKKIWLADLSAGVHGNLDSPDGSIGERLSALMDALHQWIDPAGTNLK